MIAAGSDIEVYAGWQIQPCHGPIGAGRCAVTEECVVHVVG